MFDTAKSGAFLKAEDLSTSGLLPLPGSYKYPGFWIGYPLEETLPIRHR
nr:MAG: hypothetical protein H3RhizoLitter136617_000001 [Mitovirus sp.]QDH89406.1 MAG: hypothetical protein H3Rhizo37938_000002 [Mitovirus sp.]